MKDAYVRTMSEDGTIIGVEVLASHAVLNGLSEDERLRVHGVDVFDRYNIESGIYLGRNFVRTETAYRISFGESTHILYTYEFPNAVYAYDLDAGSLIWQAKHECGGNTFYDRVNHRLYLRLGDDSTLVLNPDTGEEIQRIVGQGYLFPVESGKYLISELRESTKGREMGFGLMNAKTWELLDWVPWDNPIGVISGQRRHSHGDIAWAMNNPPRFKGYDETLIFKIEPKEGGANLKVKSFKELNGAADASYGNKLFVEVGPTFESQVGCWFDLVTEQITPLAKEMPNKRWYSHRGLLGGTAMIDKYGTVRRIDDGVILHEKLYTLAPPFEIAPEGHHAWTSLAEIDPNNPEHWD
jgi:hypothetical protein